MGDMLDVPPMSSAQIKDAGGKWLQSMYGPQVVLQFWADQIGYTGTDASIMFRHSSHRFNILPPAV